MSSSRFNAAQRKRLAQLCRRESGRAFKVDAFIPALAANGRTTAHLVIEVTGPDEFSAIAIAMEKIESIRRAAASPYAAKSPSR